MHETVVLTGQRILLTAAPSNMLAHASSERKLAGRGTLPSGCGWFAIQTKIRSKTHISSRLCKNGCKNKATTRRIKAALTCGSKATCMPTSMSIRMRCGGLLTLPEALSTWVPHVVKVWAPSWAFAGEGSNRASLYSSSATLPQSRSVM